MRTIDIYREPNPLLRMNEAALLHILHIRGITALMGVLPAEGYWLAILQTVKEITKET